jgi:hypothetical protein
MYDDPKLLWFLRAIAAIFALGAAVHALNIAGLTGFDWSSAPAKWQALDVVYLVVDAIVVAGVIARRAIGWMAFVAASASQVALYTAFRPWLMDIPADFTLTPGHTGYMDMLVTFHAGALALFAGLVVWTGKRPS